MNHILRVKLPPNRIYGLDIIRALAILFVLFEHGQILLPNSRGFIYNLFHFDGVSIFFVLSGYLIGDILIKTLEEEKLTKKVLLNFWKRRWFRTLPNYYLVLAIIVLYYVVKMPSYNFENLTSFLVFSQNLFSSHPYFFPEAWSLSIEEWFYLTIPLLLTFSVLALKLSPKKSVLFCILTVLVFSISIRVYRFYSIDINSIADWDFLFRKQVVTRLDSIIFGVFGAFIRFYYPKIWVKNKTGKFLIGLSLCILFKVLMLLNLIAFDSFYFCVLSFSIFSLSILLLLPFLSNLKSGNGWVYRAVTVFSLTSYSMYLLNLTVVQRIIMGNLPWSNFIQNQATLIPLQYVCYWLLTIIFSILLYKYYEIPMTNLRNRKFNINFFS